MGPPIQNDAPLYKKDIKDRAYRWKIRARSWYISVNMLTIATDTDIRHNIFVEDQNDSHQNIRIPLSEILLPEDFGRRGYTWNACYNFINFKFQNCYRVNGVREVIADNWQVHRNFIDNLNGL